MILLNIFRIVPFCIYNLGQCLVDQFSKIIYEIITNCAKHKIHKHKYLNIQTIIETDMIDICVLNWMVINLCTHRQRADTRVRLGNAICFFRFYVQFFGPLGLNFC